MLEWTDLSVVDDLRLRLVASDSGVRAIDFHLSLPVADATRNDNHPLLQDTVRQLRAYLAGDLRVFDLPLDMQGTTFQKRVWRELLKIPYGETRSYMQVAVAAG